MSPLIAACRSLHPVWNRKDTKLHAVLNIVGMMSGGTWLKTWVQQLVHGLVVELIMIAKASRLQEAEKKLLAKNYIHYRMAGTIQDLEFRGSL